MNRARPAAMAIIALMAGAACGTTSGTTSRDPTGVTTDQLRTHPEATLTYPASYNVRQSGDDEVDRGVIENISPTPADAQVHFDTSQGIDLVIAWYDRWLKQHGWQDADLQGNDQRNWERGVHEDFAVNCSWQETSGDHLCVTIYVLRSERFKANYTAAPPFGDPVLQAAVEQRHFSLGEVDRLLELAGRTLPRDGTADASAARANWPTGVCCATPVILAEKAAGEQPTPLLSAYHAVTVQTAEYDRPDVRGAGMGFGFFERSENKYLVDSGFVLIKTGVINLRGQNADAYAFTRGDREALLFAIAYGEPMNAAWSTATGYIKYRVATLSSTYDIAPKSCPLTVADCFNVLFGSSAVQWATQTIA